MLKKQTPTGLTPVQSHDNDRLTVHYQKNWCPFTLITVNLVLCVLYVCPPVQTLACLSWLIAKLMPSLYTENVSHTVNYPS